MWIGSVAVAHSSQRTRTLKEVESLTLLSKWLPPLLWSKSCEGVACRSSPLTGVETPICKDMNIAASAQAEQQEYITLAVSQLAKACNEDRAEEAGGSMCKFADDNNRVKRVGKNLQRRQS